MLRGGGEWVGRGCLRRDVKAVECIGRDWRKERKGGWGCIPPEAERGEGDESTHVVV